MGTRYQGPEEQVRALDAYIKLMRASDSVTSRLSQRLAEANLTTSQFGVLEALLHLGPLCQRDLARKLLKSGGNITMVVDNLEKRRLVERRQLSTDRRYTSVHLTEAGLCLIEELFPRHAAAITHELAVLTPDEQEELARLSRKLGLR